MFISFSVSEKKAISEPEKRKDKINNTSRIKKSTVETSGVMIRYVSKENDFGL